VAINNMKPERSGQSEASGQDYLNFITGGLHLSPVRDADSQNYIKLLKRILEKYLTI
jgi:hypothetical protein